MKKYLFIAIILVILSGCSNKTELTLKQECSKLIVQEKERFSHDKEQSQSSLEGLFYSTKLNSCISKWDLATVDVGTLQLGYFDVKQNKSLKEIIEYSTSGESQFPDTKATLAKAKEYEDAINLLTNKAMGENVSESMLGKSVCNLDLEQIRNNRTDELKNEYYYDTFQDIFYSKKLNTCLSKWQRYWVNDLTLQVLYYDALSGQTLNDGNLPYSQVFKNIESDKLESLLELEKISSF